MNTITRNQKRKSAAADIGAINPAVMRKRAKAEARKAAALAASKPPAYKKPETREELSPAVRRILDAGEAAVKEKIAARQQTQEELKQPAGENPYAGGWFNLYGHDVRAWRALDGFTSNDESRYFMTRIYSDGAGSIMATNGRAGMIYKMESVNGHFVPAGFYEIAKKSKKQVTIIPLNEDWQFPNLERLYRNSDDSRPRCHFGRVDFNTSAVSVSDRKVNEARFLADLIINTFSLNGARLAADVAGLVPAGNYSIMNEAADKAVRLTDELACIDILLMPFKNQE